MRLAALLALALLPVPSAAALPAAQPRACRLASTGDAVTQTGPLTGGPYVVGAATTATLRCSVQVGAVAHSGPDAAQWLASGTGVVALAATVTYATWPPTAVFVCTELTLPGGVFFWDAPSAAWTTNPNASCAVTTAVNVGTSWSYTN